MGGLTRKICHYIALWTSLLAGLVLVYPLQAQSNEARIEYALLENGTLTLHVAVPRGRTIEEATLAIGGVELPLLAQPVPLPTTQWLILDQSDGVINYASNIKTGVLQFLKSQTTTTRTGFLFYTNEVKSYFPTDNLREQETWLNGYSGQSGRMGCVGDAFSYLAQQDRPQDRSQRVLLIAGTLSRQGVCTQQAFSSVYAPVDVLVVAETVDDFYRDVVEQSGGTLYRANIQTITNRLNEVGQLWSNPAYLLSGVYNGTQTSGRLTVRLSDRSIINLQVNARQVLATEQPANALPTLAIVGGLPTETPTLAPSTVPVEAVQVVPTATQPPQQPVSSAPQNPPQAVEPTPVILPSATAQTANTAPNVAPPTAISVVSTPTSVLARELPSPETVTSNALPDWAIPVGVGIASVLVIGGVVGLLRRPKPKATPLNQPTKPQSDHTVLENFTLVEYENQPLKDQEFTEMVDAEMLQEMTQIVTEEELRDSLRPLIVARLRFEDGATYPIKRPQTTLGRLETNDISLAGNTQISREHVVFEVSDDDVLTLKIRTKNAILINERTPFDGQALRIGDVLTLAPALKATLISAE